MIAVPTVVVGAVSVSVRARWPALPLCALLAGKSAGRRRVRRRRLTWRVQFSHLPQRARRFASPLAPGVAGWTLRAQEGGGKQDEKAAAESERKRHKVEGGVKKKKREQQKDEKLTTRKLCLSLFPSTENQTESSVLAKLMKPYLRSSVEATIKQYKNYLSSKLHAERSVVVVPDKIEMLCRGTPLLNDMTLADVWKEYWNSGEDDLQLTYHRLV